MRFLASGSMSYRRGAVLQMRKFAAARDKVAAAEAQVREAHAGNFCASLNRTARADSSRRCACTSDEALGRLAQANSAPQQVAVSQAQAASAGATLQQLPSAVDEAELELSYTKIYAPTPAGSRAKLLKLVRSCRWASR